MKKKYIVIISLVAAVLGFVLGRMSVTAEKVVETKETVKYDPVPYPVTDTIFQPKPYNVYIPADTVYSGQKSVLHTVLQNGLDFHHGLLPSYSVFLST